MSSNGQDKQPTASPQRPRHQIKRSITEMSAPSRLHRHHHHLPHHRIRDRDIGIPQSAAAALQGRASLDGVVKSEGPSPNPSRRTSVLIASEDNVSQAAKKLTKKEELNIERERDAARTAGLKKSLVDLHTFSSVASRNLDLAYTAVLEKLGVLQGTIIALKELASTSQNMSASFATESRELAANVESQLDSFEDFNYHHTRIQSLQDRIDGGREKIQGLSERVDLIRQRVEGWERADREWQEKTRKRLKIIWLITSAIFFVLILLFVTAQYVPAGLEEATVRLANESISKLRHVGGGVNKSTVDEARENSTARLQSILNRTIGNSEADDFQLRVFDEL